MNLLSHSGFLAAERLKHREMMGTLLFLRISRMTVPHGRPDIISPAAGTTLGIKREAVTPLSDEPCFYE